MSIFKKIKTVLIAAILTLPPAGPLLAATDVDLINQEIPAETTTSASNMWIALVYTLVALAAVCFVAFKNTKRTHLD